MLVKSKLRKIIKYNINNNNKNNNIIIIILIIIIIFTIIKVIKKNVIKLLK
jgi:hypothetical protein